MKRSPPCSPRWSTANTIADPAAARHVETCLRCQAELARYRRLLRTPPVVAAPATSSPTPGLLGETLAALDRRRRERAIRSLLVGPATRVRGGDRRHRRRRRRDRRRVLIARSRKRQVRSPADAADPRRESRSAARFPGPANLLRPPAPKGSSSIGRAPVSKTGGWGFDSLLPCSSRPIKTVQDGTA